MSATFTISLPQERFTVAQVALRSPEERAGGANITTFERCSGWKQLVVLKRVPNTTSPTDLICRVPDRLLWCQELQYHLAAVAYPDRCSAAQTAWRRSLSFLAGQFINERPRVCPPGCERHRCRKPSVTVADSGGVGGGPIGVHPCSYLMERQEDDRYRPGARVWLAVGAGLIGRDPVPLRQRRRVHLPYVVALGFDPSGTLHGVHTLRRYFAAGLDRFPDLRFDLHGVLTGVTIVQHRALITIATIEITSPSFTITTASRSPLFRHQISNTACPERSLPANASNPGRLE